MKNIPLHIDEHELDNLLRQFVMDNNPDEFTQNTLTMNAAIIFNRTEETIPLSNRENELIQKLENAFIKRRGFGKFWLNGIILLFLISASVLIYRANSGNQIISSHQPGNNANESSPAIAGDTSVADEKTTAQTISSNTSFGIFANDSVVSDTLQNKNAKDKKEHFVSPDTHIPIEKNWYEGKEFGEKVEIPGPAFGAKASPENYKKVKDTFEVAGLLPGVMYSSLEHLIPVSYYAGEPFKSSSVADMLYFNFGEYYSISQKYGIHSRNSWRMPWQMIEYANPDSVMFKTDTINGHTIRHLQLTEMPQQALSIATTPFYFRKYEVTNKEYREFVNWVRASNGYADKPIKITKIDTIEVKDPKDNSGEQITLHGKKFRIVRNSTPTEDYKEVYNYNFFNANSPAVKALRKNSIYVYPDTLSWVKDFSFSYNEPMSNMYFWHPAYDNYPVVGVSWFQAMAFLDWKTHFHQRQLDAENIPYEIEYTLPSDIQWDIVLAAEKTGKEPVYDFWNDPTRDWITNLGISWPGHDDPYQRPNYLKNLFTKDEYYPGDYIRDGYFHTGPADLVHEKNKDNETGTKHLDPLGISWMDGNVSEWMMESYAENWKPFFDKHLAVLDADTSESTKLAKQIEMLYDKGNAKNGRLVRGANWYDERFSGRPGSLRNEAGINPKRFVDPAEQHCTIGFRYVIHVRKK